MRDHSKFVVCGYAANNKTPALKRSVREPGSLTHLQVTGSTTKHRGRRFIVGLRGDTVPSRSPVSTPLRILHGILWCYQVTPVEGKIPSLGVTPLQAPLAGGKKAHALACQPTPKGEGHVKVRKFPGSTGNLPAPMQASRLRSQVFWPKLATLTYPTRMGSVREPGSRTHAHEAKRFAALQSGGLGVANPRKHSFCCLFLRLRRKKRQQKGAWGCAPSTGFTCGGLCLRTAKHARKSVPTHSGGVCGFFDEVEKPTHPTPKGSVREPGSLTHPLVKPIEGCAPVGNMR